MTEDITSVARSCVRSNSNCSNAAVTWFTLHFQFISFLDYWYIVRLQFSTLKCIFLWILISPFFWFFFSVYLDHTYLPFFPSHLFRARLINLYKKKSKKEIARILRFSVFCVANSTALKNTNTYTSTHTFRCRYSGAKQNSDYCHRLATFVTIIRCVLINAFGRGRSSQRKYVLHEETHLTIGKHRNLQLHVQYIYAPLNIGHPTKSVQHLLQ